MDLSSSQVGAIRIGSLTDQSKFGLSNEPLGWELIRMPRPIRPLLITLDQRDHLIRLETSGGQLALRVRIVLALAEGTGQRDVATRLGVSLQMVSYWSARFKKDGVEGLADARRTGRPRTPQDIVERICSVQLGQISDAAERAGIARSTAYRLRQENPDLVPPPVPHKLPARPPAMDIWAMFTWMERRKTRWFKPDQG